MNCSRVPDLAGRQLHQLPGRAGQGRRKFLVIVTVTGHDTSRVAQGRDQATVRQFFDDLGQARCPENSARGCGLAAGAGRCRSVARVTARALRLPGCPGCAGAGGLRPPCGSCGGPAGLAGSREASAWAGPGDDTDEEIRLCRIEYHGDDDWGLALYPATGTCQPSVLPGGMPFGSAAEADDTAAIVHLTEYAE